MLSRRLRVARKLAGVATLAIGLGGCFLGYENEVQRGYVIDERLLNQVSIGTPAPKVLEILGNPSTTSTVGGDSWYYISQIVDQTFAFSKPEVTDQRVVAVYFDTSKKVQRIANYGLQDGKVFDFISRTTPTGGTEQSFLANLFRSFGHWY
ncbi:MAG: outer membrane protein assembly factor BamE [Methylobacteriaceae bacterium]|nr:outer membrane protein assembly factor BamE [Methylobacteriaceae bacterium]MBV9218288.1 outer membrane protein assembly factor BamE [Methylobacteriaceae bacterium]MBV9245354.1 outer membrane protein assembly factor BamE [Methylobacteriaceae bacterium]MBV9636411.1 outer membrane protein assembly factor BamE [Methylobacteriaceae bacterium]